MYTRKESNDFMFIYFNYALLVVYGGIYSVNLSLFR